MLCLTLSTAQAVKEWVFTIYTTHLGRNLVHKHKTIEFGVLGEQPATKYPNQLMK